MKHSDTQKLILSKASQHERGLAAPPGLPAAARNAVFRSMLKRGLLAECTAPREYAGLAWRENGDGARIALRIVGLRRAGPDANASGRPDEGRMPLVPPVVMAALPSSKPTVHLPRCCPARSSVLLPGTAFQGGLDPASAWKPEPIQGIMCLMDQDWRDAAGRYGSELSALQGEVCALRGIIAVLIAHLALSSRDPHARREEILRSLESMLPHALAQIENDAPPAAAAGFERAVETVTHWRVRPCASSPCEHLRKGQR